MWVTQIRDNVTVIPGYYNIPRNNKKMKIKQKLINMFTLSDTETLVITALKAFVDKLLKKRRLAVKNCDLVKIMVILQWQVMLVKGLV